MWFAWEGFRGRRGRYNPGEGRSTAVDPTAQARAIVDRVTDDPLARLRFAALDGLAPLTVLPFTRRPRARRGVTHPEIPAGAVTPAREELPQVLLHEAARWWQRSAPNWAPPLEALMTRGVTGIRCDAASLLVDVGAATYRVRGLHEPWVAVIVAALTGAELLPTRGALRSGVTSFAGRARR